MNGRIKNYGHFEVFIPNEWDDVTSNVNSHYSPLTFANGLSGVGALQLSSAAYKGGKYPSISTSDLAQLLQEFEERQHLDAPFDTSTNSGDVRVVGASYHSDKDYVRVWFVSDGASVLLVTYVCEWEDQEIEKLERETVVHSLRFVAPSPRRS